MKRWHVLGIGGATCSGKTTLTGKLKDAIPNTIVINQDQYFLPEDSKRHTMIPELNHANWELTTSVDMQCLMDNVNAILNAGQTELGPGLLIIEGIVVLNHPPIAKLCDQKVFVTLTKEQCWQRRQLRSYDPPDPPGYFETCVWPMYEKHYDEIKRLYSDELLILNGSCSKEEVYTEVYEAIKTELGL